MDVLNVAQDSNKTNTAPTMQNSIPCKETSQRNHYIINAEFLLSDRKYTKCLIPVKFRIDYSNKVFDNLLNILFQHIKKKYNG